MFLHFQPPPRNEGTNWRTFTPLQLQNAAAFADTTAIRVALDQDLSDFSAPLDGVAEVAFFPPMTGG